MTFKSFNILVIYRMTILEHSMFQTRFERILIYLSDGVIIRDKVEDLGHFDDKTLPRKRITFAHKNSFYSQYISFQSQFKAFSFSLCSPMKFRFSAC